MKRNLSYLLVLALLSCNSGNDGSQKPRTGYSNPDRNKNNTAEQRYVVDTVLVKYIDLTNRDEKEVVKYHLKVKDWYQPVEWTFFILSGKDTLLKEYSNEARIDKFFNDFHYVRDGEGYLDSKKKWYLDYIFDNKVEIIQPDDKRIPLFKNVSKQLAENHFENYGLTKDQAIENYKSFWEYYSDKDMRAIYFNFAPEGRSTPLLVFHPKLNKLVPVYAP